MLLVANDLENYRIVSKSFLLSCVMRNPVFRVSGQVRHKPGGINIEDG